MVRRLSLVLLLLPFLLLTSCSDDDDPEASGSTGTVAATVVVDFTGSPEEREKLEAAFTVEAGTTAWEAVQQALGEENLRYQDFGGDLGIFITGFYGVEVQGNHFWEFRLNGETAEQGVSKYVVQPGDVLEFVYSSF